LVINFKNKNMKNLESILDLKELELCSFNNRLKIYDSDKLVFLKKIDCEYQENTINHIGSNLIAHYVIKLNNNKYFENLEVLYDKKKNIDLYFFVHQTTEIKDYFLLSEGIAKYFKTSFDHCIKELNFDSPIITTIQESYTNKLYSVGLKLTKKTYELRVSLIH